MNLSTNRDLREWQAVSYSYLCFCSVHNISRLWRDQRVYRIGAGTDEIMIHIAGRAIQKQFQE